MPINQKWQLNEKPLVKIIMSDRVPWKGIWWVDCKTSLLKVWPRQTIPTPAPTHVVSHYPCFLVATRSRSRGTRPGRRASSNLRASFRSQPTPPSGSPHTWTKLRSPHPAAILLASCATRWLVKRCVSSAQLEPNLTAAAPYLPAAFRIPLADVSQTCLIGQWNRLPEFYWVKVTLWLS